MPSAEPGPRKRGPKPNPNRGAPSGYRVTARRRFELEMARVFVDAKNMQETIDLAVSEFLNRMKHEVEGFEAALANAERQRQLRAGIPRIQR